VPGAGLLDVPELDRVLALERALRLHVRARAAARGALLPVHLDGDRVLRLGTELVLRPGELLGTRPRHRELVRSDVDAARLRALAVRGVDALLATGLHRLTAGLRAAVVAREVLASL